MQRLWASAEGFLDRNCPFLRRRFLSGKRAPALVGFLYLLGLAHWAYAFAAARFDAKDWPLILRYHAVLRDALAHGKIPYVMTFGEHYSNRFLGLPETPLSPQFLLLPFLSDTAFNWLNMALLYSVSFVGLVLLARRFRLSNIPFAFLCLLFSFNGYIVSRVAVGQAMWYGYFFLPYFLLLVLNMVKGPWPKRSQLALALVLVLMELQGSFHLYVWCVMYLILIAVSNPRLLKPIAYTIVAASAVCAFRFVPAALTFWGAKFRFISGFPTLGVFLQSMTSLRDYSAYQQVGWHGVACGLGWWEFDHYISLVGFAILLYFCGWLRVVRRPKISYLEFRELDVANLLMTLLSFEYLYGLISYLPIPLIGSQRISSRFFIVPLTMFAILAAIRMESFLARKGTSRTTKNLLLFLVVLLGWSLFLHTTIWRVAEVESFFWTDYRLYDAGPAVLETPRLDLPGMRLYIQAVRLSLPVSLAAAAYFLFRYARSKPAGSGNATPS